MKKIWFVGLALATILAVAPAAMAFDTTYYFSLNGSGDSTLGVSPIYGSGSITVSSLGDITSANLLINGYSASIIGNPSPGNLASYYVNYISSSIPQTQTGSCGGYTDNFCIPFDNKLTNAVPGTSLAVDANGILFQIIEGSTPVELAIWQDDSGGYLWNEFVGGYSSTNYNKLTGQPNWVVPLTADYGEGGLPVELNLSPEPSSLLLLGTGLMSMAGFIFWKSRPSMVKVK